MDNKKSGRITARISPMLRARLDSISENYGPNDATIAEDALSALCDYVEAAGKYQRPMKMVYAGKNGVFPTPTNPDRWQMNESPPEATPKATPHTTVREELKPVPPAATAPQSTPTVPAPRPRQSPSRSGEREKRG
jgi:hypothetical protein